MTNTKKFLYYFANGKVAEVNGRISAYDLYELEARIGGALLYIEEVR